MCDANCTGESSVEIRFINGSSETFELAALSNSKQSNLRSGIHDAQKFDKLKRETMDRVAEAESKLTDIERAVQKEFTEYAVECQCIDKSVSSQRINAVWVLRLFNSFCSWTRTASLWPDMVTFGWNTVTSKSSSAFRSTTVRSSEWNKRLNQFFGNF